VPCAPISFGARRRGDRFTARPLPVKTPWPGSFFVRLYAKDMPGQLPGTARPATASPRHLNGEVAFANCWISASKSGFMCLIGSREGHQTDLLRAGYQFLARVRFRRCSKRGPQQVRSGQLRAIRGGWRSVSHTCPETIPNGSKRARLWRDFDAVPLPMVVFLQPAGVARMPPDGAGSTWNQKRRCGTRTVIAKLPASRPDSNRGLMGVRPRLTRLSKIRSLRPLGRDRHSGPDYQGPCQ